MSRLIPTACAVALVLASPVAAATPAQDLVRARAHFRAAEYSPAISLLSTLLYPTTKLTDKAQIAEAHLLLGVAYLETGNSQGADQEFEEALFLDTSLGLDPLVFSRGAIEAFESKKKTVLERIRHQEEQERLARENDLARQLLDSMVVIEKRRYFVNFLPFGAGQFQNGHRTKGTLFAASQAAFAGTSLGLFLFQGFRYGFLSGQVPPDEVTLVNRIQIAQISAGVAFYGVWAWAMIDALNHYEPTVERKPDEQYLEKFEELRRSQKKKPQQSFRIGPTAGPHRIGVGMSWEF